jgi:hypothetical protein
MTTIPNQLKITINTTIPGSQRLQYIPSMTMPNSTKETVKFNPLIKLKESVLQKVPEDLRVKEFFDSGLFDSLLNAHGFQKSPSLAKATFDGYVDNNINITLKTLFPTKSTIYIHGDPYVIADLQWKKGDWKIETKPIKRKVNTTHFNPYFQNSIMQDEINRAENQLQALPIDVAYGPNYDGVIPKAVPAEASVVQVPIVPVKIVPKPAPEPEPEPEPEPIPKPEPPPKPPKPEPNPSTELITLPKPEPEPEPELDSIKDKEFIALPAPGPSPNPKPQNEFLALPAPEKVEELAEDTTPSPFIQLESSRINTSKLRQFFKQPDFYKLINYIYKDLNANGKELIYKHFLSTTSINVRDDAENLSAAAYKQTVEGVRVNSNTGAGDCFFIAVADAINYHNYNNPNNKIISNKFGIGNMIFTQSYLRSIVYEFITEQPPEWGTNMLAIAAVSAERLNTLFSDQLKTLELVSKENGDSDEVTPEAYMDLVNSYYTLDDNFLVKKTDRVPIHVDDKYTPYSVMGKSDNIKNYILSNSYWADQTAITAICSKLKLNVITLQYNLNKATNTMVWSIPFSHLLDQEYNEWTKYLFLYNYKSHYELITFDFKIIRMVKDAKTNKIKYPTTIARVSIFDRNTSTTMPTKMPPIYILFLIYAVYYFRIDAETKKHFALFLPIFQMMDASVKLILASPNANEFITYFTKYFPTATFPTKSVKLITGGASHKKATTINEVVNICYAINIQLQLVKGKTATDKELQNSKCQGKIILINKSWAAVTGQTYKPAPDYSQYASKNNTTEKNQPHSGGNVTKRHVNSVYGTKKTNKHNTKNKYNLKNKYNTKNKTYKKFK